MCVQYMCLWVFFKRANSKYLLLHLKTFFVFYNPQFDLHFLFVTPPPLEPYRI